jgi:hypothetical protein
MEAAHCWSAPFSGCRLGRVRRLHLLELEDQSWFPARLRDAGTAYLRFAADAAGHSALLVPVLARALHASGARRIVDLCSGGGGPIATVVRDLAQRGIGVEALLTDLYPNAAGLRALAGASPRIRFEEKPVDATAVPRELDGFRTLFNAFHHFRPEQARRILADAAAARQPIAVFELVSRQPFVLASMLFAPLLAAISMFLLRPLRWDWIALSWLVPVIPLFVLWDGFVSCLRVYSPEELEGLVQGLGAPDYRWEIGRIRLGAAPAHASYLIGMPASASGATAGA